MLRTFHYNNFYFHLSIAVFFFFLVTQISFTYNQRWQQPTCLVFTGSPGLGVFMWP